MQNLDGFYEHCRNDEAFSSVVEDSEDLAKRESNDVSFVEDSWSISRKFSNKKGSVDVSESMRLPWERGNDEEFVKGEKLRKSNIELAEKLTPEPELKRLRNVALRMVGRMKVGAARVTWALVDAIHMKWKEDEVVTIAC
ncbi:CRM-domain containing factor CFM3 [Forsythia ovata]|uniref:CRM-domain containing factor CFM3 n=1 Tax=Forsythia ovata TaxID=205694 RepID=A0ABD1WBE2_9LAMI